MAPVIQEDSELWKMTLNIKAVVSPPSPDHTWGLRVMPQQQNNCFAPRCVIPQRLNERFPELTFIHPGGFYAVLNSIDRLNEIVAFLPLSKEGEHNDSQNVVPQRY